MFPRRSKERALLYAKLAQLLHAGVPILEALPLLFVQITDDTLREGVGRVQQALARGGVPHAGEHGPTAGDQTQRGGATDACGGTGDQSGWHGRTLAETRVMASGRGRRHGSSLTTRLATA